MEHTLMKPSDPYKTRPLAPITQALSQPITVPAHAIAALALAPSLLIVVALLLWGGAARPAAPTAAILATPTLGLARTAPPPDALRRATVAYDAPGGTVVGALEPGRAYAVAARSGLAWVRLDVARPGEQANLVWVKAADLPELAVAEITIDMAPPVPAEPSQAAYTAPSETLVDEEPAQATPAPAYILPPATPAPRPVMALPAPTAPPCTLRELGSVLRVCNGVTP
jgi:hypothetical protein